jgi:hypothetical protein
MHYVLQSKLPARNYQQFRISRIDFYYEIQSASRISTSLSSIEETRYGIKPVTETNLQAKPNLC